MSLGLSPVCDSWYWVNDVMPSVKKPFLQQVLPSGSQMFCGESGHSGCAPVTFVCACECDLFVHVVSVCLCVSVTCVCGIVMAHYLCVTLSLCTTTDREGGNPTSNSGVDSCVCMFGIVMAHYLCVTVWLCTTTDRGGGNPTSNSGVDSCVKDSWKPPVSFVTFTWYTLNLAHSGMPNIYIYDTHTHPIHIHTRYTYTPDIHAHPIRILIWWNIWYISIYIQFEQFFNTFCHFAAISSIACEIDFFALLFILL